MRDLISPPIFMRLGSRLRGPKDTTKVGTLKRVLISNLDCHNAPMRVTSILSGIPGYPIEDVKLSNIYIENLGGATADAAALKPPEKEDAYPEPGMFGQMPSLGFFLRHMRNVEMSHVEMANSLARRAPRLLSRRRRARRLLRRHRAARSRRQLRPQQRQGSPHRLEPRRRRHNARHRRQQNGVTGRSRGLQAPESKPRVPGGRPDLSPGR